MAWSLFVWKKVTEIGLKRPEKEKKRGRTKQSRSVESGRNEDPAFAKPSSRSVFQVSALIPQSTACRRQEFPQPVQALSLHQYDGPHIRVLASLMMAVPLTLCLFWVMADLISEEFKPQDRLELADLAINVKPDDIELIIDRVPPKLPDVIDVPPRPPDVDIVKTDLPQEPIASPTQPDLDFKPTDFKVVIP